MTKIIIKNVTVNRNTRNESDLNSASKYNNKKINFPPIEIKINYE